MKRFLLLLGLGLIIINVTDGCNKAADNTTTTTATPATIGTNVTTTNAVPPPAH